ncbi:ATP-binding cassette domain-containing protein [Leucobacter sp. UCMA 4100]|uniref:ATP-binding cassette domain-containing protein n=1 Tax=Leucobacter sp. UCMA 4100 TaxID=2810534 RepID=UPI0022EAE655|nr:ATP-binding cassette domain-containing protein [Leucobacter sp. UCMA 4100]
MKRATGDAAGGLRPSAASFAWSLSGIVLLAGAWALAARSLPEIILPGLGTTLRAFAALVSEPATYLALGESLSTYVIGLTNAAVLGALLGLVSGLNASANAALAPLFALLNAVPTVAWMGLAMIWFGLGAGPTAFLIVVTTTPILAAALRNALRERDPRYEELADAYELGRGERLRHVTVPPLVGPAHAALVSMAGLGWKLTVMGEFLTASRGLGEQLVIAKAHMQTSRVIAITILLVLVWVLVEALLRVIARWCAPRPSKRSAAGVGRGESPAAAGGEREGAIRCEGIALGHDGERIAQEISFAAAPGSVTAILGPSGIGKSSLLHVLGGIAEPFEGAIERSEGLRCSYVFQDDRLLPWRSLGENVALCAGVSLDRACDQLAQLGLGDACSRMPHELSGGMRRRGALARGFLRDASLLLLDEPFAGLDVRRRVALIEDIERMRRLSGKTIIFVTHDVEDALLLADQAIVLGGSPVASVAARVDLTPFGRERALEDPAMAEPRSRLLAELLDENIAAGVTEHHTLKA